MRSCPRSGSWVPSVAAIATEISARLRSSRPSRGHDWPKVAMVDQVAIADEIRPNVVVRPRAPFWLPPRSHA